MGDMFYGASAFNQNLSVWNVSSITDMRSMFRSASVFNQDLGACDVSSVTYMPRMFYGASSFNQNLCSWDSKSPQVLSSASSVDDMFLLLSSCNNSSTPILNSGTPGDPHDGPFCFTC
eukprot:scaffold91868_cov91-Attheya_sp.AAC.1